MKLAIVLLGLFLIADAAVIDQADYDAEELELDVEARGAKNCKCPKLNTELECKKNQKKNKFYTDDECKCPHYRCIWTICPKIVKPKCEPCQKLIEVEDCGCKSFECQNVQPNHCELIPVECKPCEKLEQTKDQCGCPQEKCTPLQNPKSQCGSCNPCEKCVAIKAGPKGCGLKQEVCKREECPHFKELRCDPDCEEPEFGETKCGCPFMKCKKLSPVQDVPQCEPCHELRKIKIEKCGIEKYQCVASPCKGPPPGKEVCFEVSELEKDSCGCKTYNKKKCDVIPAGKCPEGSQAVGGSNLCGCPHQICVPCSQMYPEPKCKKCERQKKVKVGGNCEKFECVKTAKCGPPDPCAELKKVNQEKKCPKCKKLVVKEIGQPGEGCMVKVCDIDLDNPKCRPCIKPKPISCGVCEKPEETTGGDGCKILVCVPSDEESCVKPKPCPKEEVPACGKCQKTQKIKVSEGCYKEVCVPKSGKDCEHKKEPKCPSCQIAVPETDECGCTKYTCKPKPCAPVSDIVCPKKADCDANWKAGNYRLPKSKYDCAAYASRKWCTADGNYGTGWRAYLGTFAKYADKKGRTAQVCPQCGCKDTILAKGLDVCKCPTATCVPKEICEDKNAP